MKPLEQVVEYMQRNLSNPITVDHMAAQARYSKFHFSRLFTAAYGMTPGRFLAALRIHEARRIIEETEIKIADVPGLVGLMSLGTFSNTFRQAMGIPPSWIRFTRCQCRSVHVAEHSGAEHTHCGGSCTTCHTCVSRRLMAELSLASAVEGGRVLA